MLLGAAKAGMAWAAWRQGRTEEATRLAADALEHWSTPASTFYYKGLCLWPLISVRLVAGRLGDAVDAGRQMLEPRQDRPPDELEAVVMAANAAWGRREAAIAAAKLSKALELAGELGYA